MDHAPSTVKLTTHNQYHTPRLLPDSLPPTPLPLFRDWFRSALTPEPSSPKVHEPEAMTICTVAPNGIPSSRIVLLKTVDDTGFIFFTNYNSRKSRELIANPNASLTFYWREVSRQVRVVGRAEKVSRAESEEYFATRPRGSQLGAWASEQSQPVEEDQVAKRVEEFAQKFPDTVPCPEHWGGWRIVPTEVEFWSGQPSRLHDRMVYHLVDGKWTTKRLAP